MRRWGASGWSSCGSRCSGTRPAASAPLHVVAHRVAHVADPVRRQAEHLEGRGEDRRIGLHDAGDLGVDDHLHRHAAAGADLAHALGRQDPFDLTRSVGHHTERHASPLQVEQRRHRGGQRVAPEVRRPHLVERDRGRHRVVGRHTTGQGQVHPVEVPVVVLGGLRVLGPHAGVVGPHDVLGTRIGAEPAEHGRDGRGVGHHQHAARVEQDGVDQRAHRRPYSVFSDRFSPARSPRLRNFSAILREASSIISSPNITAPMPSSSVARR